MRHYGPERERDTIYFELRARAEPGHRVSAHEPAADLGEAAAAVCERR